MLFIFKFSDFILISLSLLEAGFVLFYNSRIYVVSSFFKSKYFISTNLICIFQCKYTLHNTQAWVTLSIYLGLGIPTLFFHIIGYTAMFCKIRGRVKLAESSFKLLKVSRKHSLTSNIDLKDQINLKFKCFINCESEYLSNNLNYQ